MSFDDAEIIEEFVTESQEHLADIENQMLSLESQGAAIDRSLVDTIFRAVHSIKGAAGFLGFESIGSLSHALENVLNLVRESQLVPTSAIVDELLRSADTLRRMIDDISNSNDVDVSAHTIALEAIAAGDPAPAGSTATPDAPTTTPDAPTTTPDAPESVATPGAEAPEKPVEEHTEITVVDEMPATDRDALLFESVVDIATYLGTSRGKIYRMWESGKLPKRKEAGQYRFDPTELEAARDGSRPSASQAPAADPSSVAAPPSSRPTEPAADALVGEAPPAVDAPTPVAEVATVPAAPTADPAPATVTATPAATTIRVPVAVLDRLMNLAGELVLGRNQLVRAIESNSGKDLDSVGGQLDRITSELQEAIMQTRMQPIGNVFGKFSRIVRDLGAKLGKECSLATEGNDVELDKSIIESIADPLTHLIRNSVDHGIETPNERSRRGKSPAGSILLKAYHQAGKVNISISDDGAGIDPNRLRDKALAKDVITPEQARNMGERDLLHLIFHAGFSTVEQVTDVSGRGVGMDVVRTNIEELGGSVELDSVIGVGTTINISLPLTLAIIPSLVVRCGDDPLAIPQVNISELVRLRPSEVATRLERVKNAEVLRLRGALLPLVRLSEALGRTPRFQDPITEQLHEDRRRSLSDRRSGEGNGQRERHSRRENRLASDRREDVPAGALNIIVVESGHQRYGLVVDGLNDSTEIVVKPLGRHLKDCPCLAGATILGDGRVALILDVLGIATHMRLSTVEGEEQRDRHVEGHGADSFQVLLFTNHPAERFALPMGIIARIERLRVDQIDSVGGQDLVQYRGTSMPLFSLEQCVKTEPKPDNRNVFVVVGRAAGREIGLVVPDLVDIRTISSEIDAVTFREPGIAGSTIVDDKTTRLVDLFELAEKLRPDWFVDQRTEKPDATAKAQARVLLAEDSAFFRNKVAQSINQVGHEVIACEDGSEAWNTLRAADEPFDLVVTDIEMPNMNGYELTRKIKGDPLFAHLPVIAVTSLAGEEDIKRGLEAGVDEYQVKLDRERLLDSIARILKGVTARRADAARDDAACAQ